MQFKSRRTDEFKTGDHVITKRGMEGNVVAVCRRYVSVKLADGNIIVTIPAHGEVGFGHEYWGCER